MRTFSQLAAELIRDEAGFVAAGNYILMVTILAIGIVAGLTAVRDSVVQELGDLGMALENIDQSFTINATFGNAAFGGPFVQQFGYDDDDAGDDLEQTPPACIEICLPASPE